MEADFGVSYNAQVMSSVSDLFPLPVSQDVRISAPSLETSLPAFYLASYHDDNGLNLFTKVSHHYPQAYTLA